MKKLISLWVACLFALQPGLGHAADDTLEQIADRGEVVIGYRTNRPPFSANDDNGQPSGYTVDLCRRIAAAVKEELGLSALETRFEPVELDSRFSAVSSGDIDILCGATTITLSRLAEVDFSLMTFLTGGSLLSKAASPIRTTSDLSGKSVAVIKGTSASDALARYLDANLIDANVVSAETVAAARQLLDDGKGRGHGQRPDRADRSDHGRSESAGLRIVGRPVLLRNRTGWPCDATMRTFASSSTGR